MGRRATVVTEPVEEQAMACGGGRWAVAELGFGLSGGGGAASHRGGRPVVGGGMVVR
jgi:hypothetical protein